jgi:L-rhamnose-H+ transport protein
MTNPLLGAGLHSIGAFSSALCYTPQKKTRAWSWQTYWMAQAAVCWLILPAVVALFTTPHMGAVLSEAPRAAMVHSLVLGFCYGIGGTAFGAAIRYLGFSMTYAISIGISCVLGTLLPPLLANQLGGLLQKTGRYWVFSGIAIATVGILASGIAGKLRDGDHSAEYSGSATVVVSERAGLRTGLFFAVIAGVLSAVFGLALAAGQPIADVAARYGAGKFQGNVILIFACGGAFLSTALLCLYLHWKEGSLREYVTFTDGPTRNLLSANFALAALTGFLWYGQFFFYGMAHTYMGLYRFTSWALHMAMLVLFSAFVGVFLREWKGCRPRTVVALASAFAALVVAVAFITYGSYLGGS